NAIGAGEDGVIGAFKVTDNIGVAGSSKITKIDLDATVGTIVTNSMQRADIAEVSVWVDVNQNAAIERDVDTFVGKYTNTITTPLTAGDFGSDGSVVSITLTGDDQVTIADGTTKWFIVVVTTREVPKGATGEGAVIDVQVTLTDSATPAGTDVLNANGAAWLQNDTLDYTATKLTFKSTGYQALSGYNGTALSGEMAKDGGVILNAVDDWGNVDSDFAEKVQFLLYSYSTLEPLIADFTATANLADDDIKWGASWTTSPAMVAGALSANTGAGANGAVSSIQYNPASGTQSTVVLVARTQVKEIEGSVTISNFAAQPALTGNGLQAGRGIEIYDVNHDGHIDFATIFFNAPVQVTGGLTAAANFAIGSNYNFVANAFPIGAQAAPYTDYLIGFDAGGKGIYNPGLYGITLRIAQEDTYDTNIKPDITYTSTGTIQGVTSGTVSTFASAQAVEVDKARPKLIKAATKDNGTLSGAANNGSIDNLVLTFSEPVRNVTAGSDTTNTGLVVEASSGVSFTGVVSISSNIATLGVIETTPNTGLLPVVRVNQAPMVRITDYATSATGATAYNAFFPDKTDTGTEATFTSRDEAPMVVHTVKTLDNGGDGRLDNVQVIFSENATVPSHTGVGFYSSIAAFSSSTDKNGVYGVTGKADVSSNTFNFVITPVTEAGVYDSEALPYFSYNASLGNITDIAGNELPEYGPGALVSPTAIDGAAPVVVSIKSGDAYNDTLYAGASDFDASGANGRLDHVVLTLSEKVKSPQGAQLGGTALDNALGQFTLTHQIGGTTRVKMAASKAIGAPTWTDTDNFGETKSTVAITFQEMNHGEAGMVNGGDTGMAITTTYAASGTISYNVIDYAADPNYLAGFATASTDGAAPFVVQGIGTGWGANGIANIVTVDSDATIKDNTTDTANGDGFIDGFMLKFTENATFTATAASPFATTLASGGTISYALADIIVSGNGTNAVTILGKPSESKAWDTGETPLLSYDASKANIVDGSANEMGSFTDRKSYDKAAPVITTINRGSVDTELVITFSEDVWGHYAGGQSKDIDSLMVASSTLFGYQNNAGPGASGFTAAYVKKGDAGNKIIGTLNAAITKQDISGDLIWVKSATLYDNANAAEVSQADNEVEFSITGGGLLVKIFDDVISPWITSTKTVDADGDGNIDHLRFQFSEAIKDATLRGYIAANSMTADASATWIISGYTGGAWWNLYAPGDQTTVAKQAGYKAAVADGKPVFDDNAADDNVLYLELEEDKVPVYATTGMGSTGWVPTVTWGAAANAVTLEDKAQNLLDTAKPTVEDGVTVAPAPTNGKVVDNVGPVIMKAMYEAGVITVWFSEAIQDALVYPDIACNDFLISDTYTTGACDVAPTSWHASVLGGISWPNAGTAELTVLPDWSWVSTRAYGIQLEGTNTTKGVFMDDATATGSAADVVSIKFGGDPDAQAGWWEVGNEFCPTPYSIKCDPNTLGLVLIEGINILDATAITGNQIVGNEVLVKWRSVGVDNVDVYYTRDNGLTYTMIEGSTTPAADGQYTWMVMAGVDMLKIVATEDAGLSDTIAVAPVCPGGTDCSGSGSDTTPVDAPTDLVLMDVPGDQGHWMIAMFTTVADARVKSYQFYRQMDIVDAADPNTVNATWVYAAVIPAGVVDANGKMTCLVPDILGGEANWAVAASTSSVVSDLGAAAKEADVPVAMLVDGAEKAADVVSALSAPAVGGAIDNIAPTPIETIAVGDAETGVMVSWVAPEDHGIVGYITASGLGAHPIYGVSEYQIYRKAQGADTFEMVGVAAPMSVSYVDVMDNSVTVYEYYVLGTDGNPDNAFETGTGLGFAYAGGADYNSDGKVGLGDLVLFGNKWGSSATQAGWISAFDLNKDGSVGLGDLVLLGNEWTPGSKVAKMAFPVNTNVGIAMDAQYDEASSAYLVNFTVNDVDGLNGLGLTLAYDTEALEIVEDGIIGLGNVNITKITEEGLLDINSYFAEGEFSGTISVAFKSKGMNKDLDFELVNGIVAINSVVNAVSDLASVTLKAVPSVYSLAQNYPNPFNPTTTIEYSIPQSGHVELAIWNIAGQKVRTLVNEQQDASYRKIVWDGRNELGETVGAGLYFYKLSTGNFTKIQKMNLIK
ncbi:MAG: T9SS type A sorting domain-containing protein, partial [Candidatus Latescibacteria bacterium]|nr:T9SS type A sorting domain-containing protein [Candidatus Latescibacterota bacterium]